MINGTGPVFQTYVSLISKKQDLMPYTNDLELSPAPKIHRVPVILDYYSLHNVIPKFLAYDVRVFLMSFT